MKKLNIRFKIALCLAAIMVLATITSADTINVPGDQPSIQSGIDVAVNGDEVVVAPGTYFEIINFLGKAITVRSTDPTDPVVVANTIIDADGSGSVVTCISGEGPDTVIDGFTITGGTGSNDGFCDLGGGMYNIGSSPTVNNCTFTDNFAEFGGGMYNDFSSPTITNCTFTNNYGFGGGGIANWSNCSPTITNCTFSENSSCEGGAGIYDYSGNATVTNCTFTDNYADGYGGAIVGGNLVTNCTFSGNAATYQGGGMYTGATVINCTFTGNSAGSGGGMIAAGTVINCTFSSNTAGNGGGMAIVNGNPTVTNCTFSENSATNGRAIAFEDNWPWPPSNLTLTNCILWDGGGEIYNIDLATITISYSNVHGGFAGTGNIDIDPVFVDPGNGNLRLQPGSPCIDAGANAAVPEGIETDMDGNPRFVDDPLTKNTGLGSCIIADMGAYEFQDGTTDCCIGDLDGNGSVDTGDLLELFAQWGTAGSADFDESGTVNTIDLLILFANWGQCP
ncbi:MAG: right-handed parallel beta-helix repeat-containing protein [Planctomycetes bacterium]|nr:right-handed parallel beta-helix repeat-containing protein [Planctomycetota bacterium]